MQEFKTRVLVKERNGHVRTSQGNCFHAMSNSTQGARGSQISPSHRHTKEDIMAGYRGTASTRGHRGTQIKSLSLLHCLCECKRGTFRSSDDIQQTNILQAANCFSTKSIILVWKFFHRKKEEGKKGLV